MPLQDTNRNETLARRVFSYSVREQAGVRFSPRCSPHPHGMLPILYIASLISYFTSAQCRDALAP